MVPGEGRGGEGDEEEEGLVLWLCSTHLSNEWVWSGGGWAWPGCHSSWVVLEEEEVEEWPWGGREGREKPGTTFPALA